MKLVILLFSLLLLSSAFSKDSVVRYAGVDSETVEWCYLTANSVNGKTISIDLKIAGFKMDQPTVVSRESGAEFMFGDYLNYKIKIGFDSFDNISNYQVIDNGNVVYSCVGLAIDL